MPLSTAASSFRCCGKLYILVQAEDRPKGTPRPVAGVQVELRPRHAELNPIPATDRNGRSAHVALPEGTYDIRFTHPDFTTVEITGVNLQAWPPVELTVTLPRRHPITPRTIHRHPYRMPLITRDGGAIRIVIRN
ncbi:MAG: carboxypeptidase-like regulatory domain-containing protein [Acidobacteriota bacterium]